MLLRFPVSPWLVGGAASLVLLAVAGAQVAHRPVEAAQRTRSYEGVSDRGELQTALNDAVRKAARAQPGADRLIRYRVREITGEQGGIRGLNTVRVNIELLADDARTPEQVRLPEQEAGSNPRRQAEALRQALSTKVSLEENPVDRGSAAVLQLTVRNTSESAVRVPQATGQRYEFEVWRDGRLVWRWSQGRAFTQSLTTLLVPAGAAITYKEVWNLRNSGGMRVPAGKYDVRAYLPTRLDDERLGDAETLTISGR